MTRTLLSQVILVVLALMGAQASAREAPVAFFDLRPVNANGQTDLDGLDDAVATTRRLRAALHGEGFEILPTQDFRLNLGPSYRVKLFECREQVACLRSRISRLARLHVRRAIFGTYSRQTGAVRLVSISFSPYGELGHLTFRIKGNDAAITESMSALLTSESRTRSRPTPPPAPAPPPEPASDAPIAYPEHDEKPAPVTPPPAAPKDESTEVIADDGGDVVESLVDESKSAPPAEVVPDRVSLTGWARLSLELGLNKDGFHKDRPEPLVVPYDALVERQEILLRARFARERKFEASIEGYLGFNVFEGLPASPDQAFDGFNGDPSRLGLETQLRDTYLAFFTKTLDIRVGQQRVVWGHGDLLSPNDILNARDIRNPIMAEPELLHIPTPIVRADLYLPVGSLQLIYNPFFVPTKLDYFGSNWALIQPTSPDSLRRLDNLLSTSLDTRSHDPLQDLLTMGGAFPLNLQHGSFGGRYSWTVAHVDVNHYYQYGYDPTPLYTVEPVLAAALGQLDPTQPPPASLTNSLVGAFLNGPPPIRAEYFRRHHFGTDVVTTAGPFVLRLDVAYDTRRIFTRPDLSGAVSNTVEAVGGVEYQTGELGKAAILEVSYLHLFHTPDGTLLFASPDMLTVAGVIRWIFAEHFETELRVAFGVAPSSVMLRPQIGYKFEPFVWSVGAIYLDGADNGFGGYFRRNKSLYTTLRYAF